MRPFLRLHGTIVIAAGFALVAAAEPKKDDPSFLEKMDRWQQQMTEAFRDTWRKLRSERSVATASIDLREQQDSYTLRLNLPKRDLNKVEITLEDDTLRIVAPKEGQTGRYEQSVVLEGTTGAEPKIERKSKDDLLVVTVPKTGKSAPERAVPPDSIPDPSLLPLTNWDREILDRMERMRREMDRLFADGLRNFGRDRKDVFDEARFGSAIDLQEEGDNYIVRAYLPDRNMDQVNVTLEGQTLKIEAREQQRRRKESDSGAVQSSRTSAYSQVFTLPGPVQEEKMKVDRKENMVVITLPKAK